MSSSTISLLPTNNTTDKKRRPAFRPANQKKKAAKIPTPTKVVVQRKNAETIIAEHTDPLHTPQEGKESQITPPYASSLLEHTSHTTTHAENQAPLTTEESQVPGKQSDGRQQRSSSSHQPPDDGVPVTALSRFCSSYRSKGVIVKEKQPVLEPPPMMAATTEPTTTAGPVVQIINGEIVLQASSMVVPNVRKTVAELEEEFDQVVEEEGHTAVVGASYNSFVQRRKPQHWNVTETKLFYSALRQVGTDFACMESYFEDRTRKQLKRKYQIESSKNPKLIELALDPKAKVAIDLSVFHVDKDSIVITKETPIIHQPTTEPFEPPPTIPEASTTTEAETATDQMEVVDETEIELPTIPTLPPMSMESIFGDDPLFDNFKELVENTQSPDAAIPLLAPTNQDRVNKRPKFKARAKKK